jgi:hypothetical protein
MNTLRFLIVAANLFVLSTLTVLAQTGESWKASLETVERLSKSRPEFNYYEEKVPAYMVWK